MTGWLRLRDVAKNKGGQMQAQKKSKYVKVRLEGGSVVLTVGSAIPKDWKLVEIIVKASKDGLRRVLTIVKVA